MINLRGFDIFAYREGDARGGNTRDSMIKSNWEKEELTFSTYWIA